MSRVSTPGQDKTWEAAADLSASQFCLVTGVAGPAGGVQARVNLTTGRGIGILQNKPSAAGQGAVVRLSGTSKLKVDGSGTAIAAGDPIRATTGGVGIKAVTDKDPVSAIAMEPSVANGDIIEVLIQKFDLAV